MTAEKTIKQIEKEDVVLYKNPINPESKTFIFKSDSNRENVVKKIKESLSEGNFKDNFMFSMYIKSFVHNVDHPVSMVNQYFKDPCAIHLDFSGFNKFSFNLSTYFYPPAFKDNFLEFCFYHELGHTSKYQRNLEREESEDFAKFKELHSDFFSVYCTLRDMKNKPSNEKYKYKTADKPFEDFLTSYLKLRSSNIFSPKDSYSIEYSEFLHFIFTRYFHDIDFELSYKEVDIIAYNFALEVESKSFKDAEEYFYRHLSKETANEKNFFKGI